MTELFDDEEIDNTAETFSPEDKLKINTADSISLDARRRLEKKLEEKRLRDELEDNLG